MTFNESLDAASHCGRAALGMMDRHGIPAYPDNFAVWYLFVSGRNRDLSAAIDAHLKNRQPFTAEINAGLHARFIAPQQGGTDLSNIAQRLEEAARQVELCLREVDRGATQYGAALENFSGDLSGAGGEVELTRLVRSMLDETKAMIDINRRLDQQLALSSGEVVRLREDIARLRREAKLDHLTGLANRKTFDTALVEAMDTARHKAAPLSLMMVDIDYFKQFNDTHGHVLGDQVLKLVGRILADGMEADGVAARYGGEEFAVVLPGKVFDAALALAESVREAVASRVITNRRTGQALGQVTLSVGIAQYNGTETPATLVQRADDALYRAKRDGRNRVCGDRTEAK
jgi:diguanylate cyclase